MTFSAPESIASGCSYTVTEVSGRPPVELGDFVGDVAFIAVKDAQQCRIEGTGRPAESAVRFHEKDGPSGKDLRVWEITVTATNEFRALSLSIF